MRKPEHINIYIIVRIIFFCANPPTTLFILINSSLEMGQLCETGPWGFLSLTQTMSFFLLRRVWCVRRGEREKARKREGSRSLPAPPVLDPQSSAGASEQLSRRTH